MAPAGGPGGTQPLVRLGSQANNFDAARRVKLNVGGTTFETTLGTVQGAGKGTALHAAVTRSIMDGAGEAFFDRDADMFALLLTALRTGKLEAPEGDAFPLDRLVREAAYYGVVDRLRAAMAPDALDGVDAERQRPVIPGGLEHPSAMAAGADGSLWLGHGSKVTVYDWALRRRRSTVTELSTVKELERISDALVVAGADNFPGLHVYNVEEGRHVRSVTWLDKEDPRIYNPGVKAIASNDGMIFGSLESGQKLDNTLLLVDKGTLAIDREMGRQSGGTGHSKVATKLQWLPEKNLLLAGASHGGAFGYSGYIRLWDVRQEKIVWDWEEPHYRNPRVEQRDVFADISANEELGGIFKVSINSGAMAMADLRHLDDTDPWLALTETNPELEAAPGGADNRLLTHNKQIYVSRGGNLEVWSEVPLADTFNDLAVKEYWDTSFRRNFVDYRRHTSDPITRLAVGGDRLFVSRKGHQAVEVWETRRPE